MKTIDLNLLPALNILLEERNVARAAKRMNLSQSAMSRTLARLRRAMDDPVLVRAGRGLVPSPRALEIQARVSQLATEAEALLQPAACADIAGIERTFTLLTSDGFMESIGGELIKRAAAQAPGIRIRFLPRTASQGSGLRDGSVDIETGKLSATTHPELLVRRLFDDHFIGVTRKDHPLSHREVTASDYLGACHIGVTRDGQRSCHLESMLPPTTPVSIPALVGSYTGAVALARATDLIATVPARHTASFCHKMHRFPLPFDVPAITISMFWHPRMNADQAHRWLRETIIEISAEL